jgi:hypothetical protein
MDKRIKSFQGQIKKEEKAIFKENFLGGEEKEQPIEIVSEMTAEIEDTFKEISNYFMSIRDSIKKSFDEYLETLGAFAGTKEKLLILQMKSNENYNDCSPIIDRKLDLLLNLNQGNTNNLIDSHLDFSQPLMRDSDRKVNRRNSANLQAFGSNAHISEGTIPKDSYRDNIYRSCEKDLHKNFEEKNNEDNSYDSCSNVNDPNEYPFDQGNQLVYQQLISEEIMRDEPHYKNFPNFNNENNREKIQMIPYEDQNLCETNQVRRNSKANVNYINASSSHLSLLTPLKPRRIFPSYASTSVGKSKSNVTDYPQENKDSYNNLTANEKKMIQQSRSKMLDAYYNSKYNSLNNLKSADKENCSISNNLNDKYTGSHLKFR